MTAIIKPLSVNHCRQGRRFKTKAYLLYEKTLLQLLPELEIKNHCPIVLIIHYYFSNIASDIDNPTKPLLDILQKKYWFDDKYIFEKHEYKHLVKAWQERIEIDLKYCEYDLLSVKRSK